MKKYLHIILSALILTVAILLTLWMISVPVKASVVSRIRVPMPVSTVVVEAREHAVSIQAFGKATPYWKTDIVSAVSGRLVELSPAFDAGQSVAKGELLAKVEDVGYRSEVAARVREVADAQLAYVQEERKVHQAKKDWKRMGHANRPASPLVLRRPHLQAAVARVEAAEGALAKAQNDYENTQIVAPYDAAIVERKVALGTYVSAGTVIGSIYGTEVLQVRFPLTGQQCKLLNLDGNDNTASRYCIPVKMVSVTDSNDRWLGTLTRVELQISGKTRQRTAIVMVSNPLAGTQPLLPGAFVRAEIPGVKVKDTMAVPESALTQDGDVWFVDGANLLQRIKPKIQFQRNGEIYITHPKGVKELQVVVRPLNTYLAGCAVKPVLSELDYE